MRAIGLGAALFAALFLAGCADSPQDAPETRAPVASGAGSAASAGFDFALPRHDGGTFRLSEHRGEVVVVNFWATWCLPCLAEIPTLVELQDDLRDQDVLIIGISQDTEGLDVIRSFAEQVEVNYPLLADPDLNVSAQFGGVPILPTTFVLDREGAIHASEFGALDREELLDLLDGLIDPTALPESAASGSSG